MPLLQFPLSSASLCLQALGGAGWLLVLHAVCVPVIQPILGLPPPPAGVALLHRFHVVGQLIGILGLLLCPYGHAFLASLKLLLSSVWPVLGACLAFPHGFFQLLVFPCLHPRPYQLAVQLLLLLVPLYVAPLEQPAAGDFKSASLMWFWMPLTKDIRTL